MTAPADKIAAYEAARTESQELLERIAAAGMDTGAWARIAYTLTHVYRNRLPFSVVWAADDVRVAIGENDPEMADLHAKLVTDAVNLHIEKMTNWIAQVERTQHRG